MTKPEFAVDEHPAAVGLRKMSQDRSELGFL
jgi:hypothetical protein